MKRKIKLFIIDNGVLIDKLIPCRKVSKDLYLVKIDTDNRCVIDYYMYLQCNKHSFYRGLYNDYLLVDKYGKLQSIILKQQKNANELIKRYIKGYKKFKKEIDFETYKLKQLMKYVAYKIKIGEY